MKYWDMLVETPARVTDLEDHAEHHGDAQVFPCSDCGVGPLDPRYPLGDISTVRHWNIDSVDETGGGHWTWYCPEHLEQRNGRWWKSSHLAPVHLLPEETHYCSQAVGVQKICGEPAAESFEGTWRCEKHAATERMNRRIEQLLSDDESE